MLGVGTTLLSANSGTPQLWVRNCRFACSLITLHRLPSTSIGKGEALMFCWLSAKERTGFGVSHSRWLDPRLKQDAGRGLFGHLTEALSVFTGKMRLDTQTHRFVSNFTLSTDLGNPPHPCSRNSGEQPSPSARRPPGGRPTCGEQGTEATWPAGCPPCLTLWPFLLLPDGHRALSPFLLPREGSGGRGLLCAWSLFS